MLPLVPVNWLIDSRSRLVLVTAEGEVTRAEMEEYLEVVTGAGANGYAKIFDGRSGKAGMDTADMLALGATFRAMHGQPHGPLAIVLEPARRHRLQPVLGMLAAAERPIRFFTSLRTAMGWIKEAG